MWTILRPINVEDSLKHGLLAKLAYFFEHYEKHICFYPKINALPVSEIHPHRYRV